MNKSNSLAVRWAYLCLGVAALLFTGVNYTWSILKAPLAEEFLWTTPQLALSFTLTMSCFCLGCFFGGLLSGRFSCRLRLILAAALSGAGLTLVSRMSGKSLFTLYFCYSVMSGLGIGIAYNAIISTVSTWFPDRKGLCSGALMMGFGASAMLVGKLAAFLIDHSGWRTAYLTLALLLAAALLAAALLLKSPGAVIVFPSVHQEDSSGKEDFEGKDYPTLLMLRRFSFWLAFFSIVCMAAVGNTMISLVRDLCLSVGASAALATTLVGVFSICNGLVRIFIGALFDRLGRKKTMLFANLLTIAAAGTTLFSVLTHSLPVCILGLCLTGFSYGSAPTIASALTAAFYGTRFFPLNFSVMNFYLMFASFMATAAGGLLETSGGYLLPFAFLLGLAVLSLPLTLLLRRP